MLGGSFNNGDLTGAAYSFTARMNHDGSGFLHRFKNCLPNRDGQTHAGATQLYFERLIRLVAEVDGPKAFNIE